MAWMTEPSNGYSVQDLAPILAELETAVVERENMIFGLSQTGKTAADYDGYTLYFESGQSEDSVRDVVVDLRTRITALLGSGAAPSGAIRRYGRFTNADRDALLIVPTGSVSAPFESVFDGTDETEWVPIASVTHDDDVESRGLVTNLAIYVQLRQVLERMVYVCWRIKYADWGTISTQYYTLDGAVTVGEMYDYVRGGASAPSGTVTEPFADVGYLNYLRSFSVSGGVGGGKHRPTSMELETTHVVGDIEASYLGFRKFLSLVDPTTYSLNTNWTLTIDSDTWTISSGLTALDSLETVSKGTGWPDTGSNEVLSPSYNSFPVNIPTSPSEHLIQLRFQLAAFGHQGQDSGTAWDSIFGTRVHTDVSGEFTYG